MPHKDQEVEKAYMKQYRLTHRKEFCAYNKKYVHKKKLEDPGYVEKIHAQERARYPRHAEKKRSKNREWSHAHRAKRSADNLRWRHANPEKSQANKAQRRAREFSTDSGRITGAQWKEIKAAYGYRCVYCGRKMQRLTMDHLTPLSKGGSHTVHNIVPACQSCNSRKHTGAVLCPVQPILLTVASTQE